jgi:hypothetical protein
VLAEGERRPRRGRDGSSDGGITDAGNIGGGGFITGRPRASPRHDFRNGASQSHADDVPERRQ